MKIYLLIALTVFALSDVTRAVAPTTQRPNVLFVFLDDYGWRDCGFMGSDYYETPNLDALAREGMIFTNAYSSSANCAPARACLLSGQYTPRHEIYNVGTSLRGNPKWSKLKTHSRHRHPAERHSYLGPSNPRRGLSNRHYRQVALEQRPSPLRVRLQLRWYAQW